jgi:Tfp pilus assembly protein PilE
MKPFKGQTLIELVIFIVVLGIVLTPLLTVFNSVLKRSNQPQYLLTAAQLADARMNMILQQRRINGFTNISDPCSTGSLNACTALKAFATNHYVVSSSIPPAVNGIQTVTVTVTGTGTATNLMRFVQ